MEDEMALKSELVVGQVVVVGPRYVMADAPPFAGNGRMEVDEWTDRAFRVVGFLGDDARLAPPDLADADESDEVVSIHCRRLTASRVPEATAQEQVACRACDGSGEARCGGKCPLCRGSGVEAATQSEED
jgi:DnaJ-class molecular chaperone